MAARRFAVPRITVPHAVSRHTDRLGRSTIPYPRLLGLVAGILGLLLLMLLSWLVFGGTDLGGADPASSAFIGE